MPTTMTLVKAHRFLSPGTLQIVQELHAQIWDLARGQCTRDVPKLLSRTEGAEKVHFEFIPGDPPAVTVFVNESKTLIVGPNFVTVCDPPDKKCFIGAVNVFRGLPRENNPWLEMYATRAPARTDMESRYVGGDERVEVLKKFRLGLEIDGYTVWYTPYSGGGTRQLSSGDEVAW